jgi:Amt family ammonium transporter
MSAIVIGLAGGFVCFSAVNLKSRFGYDDSLDVVGVHLAGGIVGSVLLGVFAQSSVNEFVPDGLLFGGGAFFIKQVVAVLAVMAFTFVASYILARIVKALVGLRVDENQETEGLDISLHEERGYVLSE